MRNTFIFLSFLLAIPASAFAGTDYVKGPGKGKNESKFTLGVSIGAGIPLRDYAGTSLILGPGSEMSGWAKTGIQFNVNAGYKLGDHIGAVLMLGGDRNGFNAAAYDAASNNASNTTKKTSHYIGSYLIGPSLTYEVSKKFDVNFRVTGGLMTAAYAELIQSSPSSASDLNYGSANAFGYDGGAGLTYILSNKLGITFSIDYLGGMPVYTSYTSTYSPAGFPSQPIDKSGLNQPMNIGILNISLGAVLHL
jgi:hypothetical protein